MKILFWILIFFALLSIFLIHTEYFRSIFFFLLISLAILVLLLDLLRTKIETQTPMFIFQILAVLILIRIIPLVFIPGFYLDDPYYHEWFSSMIVLNHFIPIDTSYSPFPIMHLLLSISQIVTNASFKFVGTLFLTVLQALLIPIFIYLISKKIFNNLQISLIAALIFGFSDIAIGQSIVGPFPTTYAIIIISLIFLIFMIKKDIRFSILIFLLSFTLIISHSLSALIFELFIIFIFICLTIAERIKIKTISNFELTTILIFSISFILYWIFASNLIFEKFVEIGFGEVGGVKASFSSSGGISYAQLIPVYEYILELSGKFFYFGFALVGLLFSIRTLKDSIFQLIIIVFGLLLFFIGGIGLIFAFGIAPDRILYYSYFFLAIPATIGIILLFKHNSHNHYIFMIIAFLFISLMITNSVSNKDSPIFSSDFTSKRYIDYTERISVDTMIRYSSNSRIISDNDLSNYIKYIKDHDSVMIPFNSPKFENYKGSIIITRAYFQKYPIYSKGLYRINYEPAIKIPNSGFSHVYDSKIMNMYV